jgi:hypothetical protein
MRVKSELQPGQAARGDKLTISEVLAKYLRAEKGRLAPKTCARYASRAAGCCALEQARLLRAEIRSFE